MGKSLVLVGNAAVVWLRHGRNFLLFSPRFYTHTVCTELRGLCLYKYCIFKKRDYFAISTECNILRKKHISEKFRKTNTSSCWREKDEEVQQSSPQQEKLDHKDSYSKTKREAQ